MNKAFTLIELIVSIVIITVLFAILLPVIFNGRSKGRQSEWATNLRTLGQSMRLYIDDNDGTWPSTGAWMEWNHRSPSRYAGCPASPTKDAPYMSGVVGYAYNGALAIESIAFDSHGYVLTYAAHDRDIAFPAVTVPVCDSSGVSQLSSAPDPHKNSNPYPYGIERGWERHSGAGNYLFCDNHVKLLHADDVIPARPPINDGTKAAFALRTKNKP